jgi:hypothetical protein
MIKLNTYLGGLLWKVMPVMFTGVLLLAFMLPLIGCSKPTETGAIKLNTTTIRIITGAAFIVDIVLFFLSTKTFQREETLTKWT